MNIALLIDTLVGGGAEGVVGRLAAGLTQRGHRAFIYCLKQAGTGVSDWQGAGVAIREAHSVGRDPWLAGRLAGWLLRDRIQIVHAHSCAALVWVFPAAKLLKLPIVHVRHGWPIAGPSRYGRMADCLSPFVERLVVNCQSGRRKLPVGRVARRAVYVPNGIDVQPAAAPAARDRLEELCGRQLDGPVILSVANIRAEKDVCGLLRGFARLHKQQPNAALVCVGTTRDAACWAQARQEVRALNLDNCTHFPGYVPDAARLMTGADVFCLSSRTEGLPNVILEAMAQGVPIVATAVGDVGRLGSTGAGEHFLLHHNRTGLLVPPANPAALAAALRYALHDRRAAQQRARRAAAVYARSYTTARMVEGYEHLYAGCVRGGRHSARPTDFGCAKRPTVVMLGPAAPQIGGMVSAIDGLMSSSLCRRYELHRFATTTGCSPARPRGTLHCWVGRAASATRHLGALLRLGRMIVERRVALVHIHTCSHFTFYRNLLDLVLVRLLGRKAVLHIRGGRFAEFCASSNKVGRWLIRRGCELAHAVVVLSPGWRAWLSPFMGRAHVVAVPNGVAIPAGEPTRDVRLEATPVRFLFLGPLTESKGLGDLIDAAQLLEQDGVPFHLRIAGPALEDERSKWEQRIAQNGLARRIRLAGPVRGADKARLFASADCLVHPSHSEGLPHTVLEAAAASLPVIATAVGAVPDLLTARTPATLQRRGPLAPLVPPHDPPALAREMARLATDQALRQRIGEALGAHVAANYSLDRTVARIARLYESILPYAKAAGAVSRISRVSVRVEQPGKPEAAARAVDATRRDHTRDSEIARSAAVAAGL